MILHVNTQSEQPIYEQLREQIIIGIATGKLVANEALPSVRRLSADLGINLHTVNKVYTILCDEGYLKMDRRKGAVVANAVLDDKTFKEKLKEKLLFIAAEVVCRKISEDEFVDLCLNSFKKANNKEGETNE